MIIIQDEKNIEPVIPKKGKQVQILKPGKYQIKKAELLAVDKTNLNCKVRIDKDKTKKFDLKHVVKFFSPE